MVAGEEGDGRDGYCAVELFDFVVSVTKGGMGFYTGSGLCGEGGFFEIDMVLAWMDGWMDRWVVGWWLFFWSF